MKNNSNKQRRRRRGRRNPKNNYSRTIKLNMGSIILKIIVIVLLALLITTLTAKTVMTRIGGKVLDNLSGDTTEDVWQIIPASDEEETEENTNDDGISTVDDSSDYTITVTEYTGDTLEAEFDYGESGKFILYIVDAESWQLQNAYTFSYSDTTVYSFSDYYSLEDGMRCGTSPIFAAESMRGRYRRLRLRPYACDF